MNPLPTPSAVAEALRVVPDGPILAWIGPLIVAAVGIVNLAFQVHVFKKTVDQQRSAAEKQDQAATLNASVAYMRDVFEIVSAGGSMHDQDLARDSQRALLRSVGRRLKEKKVPLPVSDSWPEPLRQRFTLRVAFPNDSDRWSLIESTVMGYHGVEFSERPVMPDGRRQVDILFLQERCARCSRSSHGRRRGKPDRRRSDCVNRGCTLSVRRVP